MRISDKGGGTKSTLIWLLWYTRYNGKIQRLFSHKLQEGSQLIWSGDDTWEILEYFAIAITIVAIVVPEGLLLALTLSLAFAIKKMMNDKTLVRHLAACETMGSTTTICSEEILYYPIATISCLNHHELAGGC
ncbi:hypothetical protein C1H46_004746 [Malus baccata]|uniref:Uncharacterized protein n=1 Tax=Malus baccata TaxID=106549 RepID=A0A540NGB0_MALBA|nr:hypothetical protein C1H46_004746 [Malus baccata]